MPFPAMDRVFFAAMLSNSEHKWIVLFGFAERTIFGRSAKLSDKNENDENNEKMMKIFIFHHLLRTKAL